MFSACPPLFLAARLCRRVIERCFCAATSLVLLLLCLGLMLAWLPSPAANASEPEAKGYMEPAQPLPDLLIEQIAVTPPNPGPGVTADIVVTIKNQGNANAAGFLVYLYVEPVDDPPTASTRPTSQIFIGIGLVAGGSIEWTRTRQAFTQTNPKVYAWVDPDNRITESNENNNLYPPVEPENPDGYEDDDYCNDAHWISTDGSKQARNLFRQGRRDDVDWVKFAGVANVRYEVEAEAVGADADLGIELHANCSSPGSFGSGVKFKFTAPTDQVYYLKISHNDTNYGPDTDYRLSVKSDSRCSTSLEPNDFCSLPVDIAVGAGPETHSFCSQADEDWMRFAVKAGAKYKIKVLNVGERAQAQMSLYSNCAGTPLANGSQIEYLAPASGFAYVRTSNANPDVFGPGTDYTFSVELDGPDGCVEDALEDDNSQPQAQPVRVNGNPQTRNACPTGDIDWMKFEAQRGQTYTVETVPLGAKSDTILCRYNASGVQMECDRDSGPGHGSRLTYRNAEAGTYFFAIRQDDGQLAGPDTAYAIQVITGECRQDAAEPDNERAGARAIATDGTGLERNICPRNDADWVKFPTTANTTYVIRTTPVGPEADTIIELYDAGGGLMATNDDFSPGIGSQIVFRSPAGGEFYLKTYLFNPERYGSGSEYVISVQTGTAPTPTPTPTPPPPRPDSPPEPPTPTGLRTLILVNGARLATLHGEAETTALLAKLEQLAQHSQVRGEIIRLDQNAEVSAAYAAWTANITNVDRANQLAAAIRRLIMTYLMERRGIEYVVLVGDDRALPFRRVADLTPRQSESRYGEVDGGHPTGAALRANYYLTDDYYVDKEPTPHEGREIYIPDLSIGRLIETPADMIHTINLFLAQPHTVVEQVLVTGYDFVRDTAQEECRSWREALGNTEIVSCLVGTAWTRQEFSNLQLRNDTPFKVQSINGHAAHFAQGIAAGGIVAAADIAQAALDLSGGLIYTLGCHGGLNVPPTNSVSPLDLPEVFVRKGANYVGNTGFGWGLLNSIGLSEKVIRLYNRELTRNVQASMGKALSIAKRLYFEQDQSISVYDEKVIQQFIFYGLPMRTVQAGGGFLGLDDDFPGVGFDAPFPTGSFGDDVITSTVRVDFSRVLDPEDDIANLDVFDTGSGQFLALNGSISADAGEPVQPLHFGALSARNIPPARAAVLRRGTYITQEVEDILVGTPVNEYVPRDDDDEFVLDAVPGWYPEVPSQVRAHGERANLVTQLGQYDPSSGIQRLYARLELEIYYSASTDTSPPDITFVDGLYEPISGWVQIKVGATDPSGVERVLLAYIRDTSQANGSVDTINLAYNEVVHKWVGSFLGSERSAFFVQAVDHGGNLTTAANKGAYYKPALARGLSGCPSTHCSFLPVLRQHR